MSKKLFALLLTFVLMASLAGCTGSGSQTGTEADDAVENNVVETDVVVIGGGGAGLAAAVEASGNGAEVILVEKMSMLGGNTIRSAGLFNAVDPERQEPAGVEDSVDLHYEQTYEGGDKKGNPDLIRFLVENALDSLHWLEDFGVQFDDEVSTAVGALWKRTHTPSERGGASYIDTLSQVAEDRGTEILLETKAEELLVEDGRVVGIRATSAEGEELVIKAEKGVILAAGGFGANVEMREQYNPEITDQLPTTSHPGATGDGVLMAQEIGANLVGMEEIQLHPHGDPVDGTLNNRVRNQDVAKDIYVNKEGKRFVNENSRRDDLVAALMAQTDSTMYIVTDGTARGPEGQNLMGQDIDTLVEQGRVFSGETIEELAEAAGMPAEALVETVEKYNEAVDKGQDEEFGKENIGKIEVAPFYATPRVPTVHHTMGGVEINVDAQVLDTEGNPIAGLYAAGEVTGGVHGGNRLGGNAIPDIITFGRVAGRNVVAD